MLSRRWTIDPLELARRLTGPVEERPVVLDVRANLLGPDGALEFAAGHVPGARWVDLETDLSAHGAPARDGSGGRHPLPRPEVVQAAMRRVGVHHDQSVVAMDSGHLMGAARLWWLLRDLGHEWVSVLDGGFAAWRAAGLRPETGATPPVPEGDFVAGKPRLPVVDADGVRAALAAGRQVVDVRAAARYRGDAEPIDPVAGHVPGAVNLPSGRLFDEAGTRLRTRPELESVLSAVEPGAVLYCGSGVTAAQAALALAAVGRHDVELYAGSWSDWISDPTRPVATGADPIPTSAS